MKPATPAPSALAAIKAGPPVEPIDKTRRIPEKTRRAIELLATGKCKTQTEAAVAVGTTRETLCRNLAKPHILEFMRQRAMRTIAMAAGRAAEVKAELLDCADNMVRDRASSFVLGTAGIGPDTAPSLNINLEMRAGYILDLREDPPAPPMRVVSP
jgi:phage terminase small subunit